MNRWIEWLKLANTKLNFHHTDAAARHIYVSLSHTHTHNENQMYDVIVAGCTSKEKKILVCKVCGDIFSVMIVNVLSFHNHHHSKWVLWRTAWRWTPRLMTEWHEQCTGCYVPIYSNLFSWSVFTCLFVGEFFNYFDFFFM